MSLIVDKIFREEMEGDTSFQVKDSFLSAMFGEIKHSKKEMRSTWDSGIKYGIEIGLRRASLEGQRIQLDHNTKEGKNKEFLERFYKLAEEYNCAIQYHPLHGMVVLDQKPNIEGW